MVTDHFDFLKQKHETETKSHVLHDAFICNTSVYSVYSESKLRTHACEVVTRVQIN